MTGTPPPEPRRPWFDARRLAWAAVAGLAGGTAVGLLLGFVVGVSGGMAGTIAGAGAILLVQQVDARLRTRR